jgi:hypothetical protein
MKREFKIYCKEIDNGLRYKLILEMNKEIVKEEVYYGFDEVLCNVSIFYSKYLTEYEYDTRFDNIEVNINYELKLW